MTLDELSSTNMTSKQQIKQTRPSWSVLKHLMLSLKPRVVTCSAQVAEVSRANMLDAKEKIRQATDLEREIREFIINEPVLERFQRLYAVDVETGKDMPHLQRLKASIKMIVVGLYGVGFIMGYFHGKEDFMKTNKATMFASVGQANKRRYNHIMQCALKQGLKMGFQGGAVCVSLFALYQGLEVYFNKSTPLSMATACGVMGSLSKVKIGPKGMFAGAVLGTCFGAVGGAAGVGLQKLAGETQEEVNYELVKKMVLRKKQFVKPKEPVPENYTEDVDNLE